MLTGGAAVVDCVGPPPNEPKGLDAPNGFISFVAPNVLALPPKGAVDVGAPKMPLVAVGVFVLSTPNVVEFCPKPLKGVAKEALD
jgi:hypothetical protein